MLHALLLILPFVQEAPELTRYPTYERELDYTVCRHPLIEAPDPEAWRRICFIRQLLWQTQAPGVRLDLKIRIEEESFDGTPVVRKVRMQGTLARPASGKLKITMRTSDDESAEDVELVGTGEQVHMLAHSDRVTMELGESWTDSSLQMVDMLSAWAGAPLPELTAFESLPDLEDNPRWSGHSYRQDDSTVSVWFEGRSWRRSVTVFDAGTTITTEVVTWELLNEVDEEALRGTIPLGYASGIEMGMQESAASIEESQEPQVEPAKPAKVFPGGDPEAVAYLQTALARYGRAEALHFRLSGTMEDGESFGTMLIEGRIAKPASGSVDIQTRTVTTDEAGIEQEQLESMSFVGTGEAIRQVEHSRRMLAGRPVASWKESNFISSMPTFCAWAGAPLPSMRDLTFAKADSENYPQHVGLQWFDENDGLFTMWFDTGGAWIATHVERNLGPEMRMTAWVSVESMELVSEIDPSDYNAESPAGYDVDYSDEVTGLVASPPPPPLEVFDYDPEIFPLADADALAYLLTFRDRCAAATALHFKAEATMDSPDTHGEMSLSAHIMLPASGTVESTAKMYTVEQGALQLSMDRSFGYIGDGKLILEIDFGGHTISGVAVDHWSKAAVVQGLFVFSAWSGSPPRTMHGLAFAPAQEKRPGQTGVTWQTDNRQQQTWWFDGDGNWVGCTMVDGVDESASMVQMTVTEFKLDGDPDPADYLSELPDEFPR